MASEEEEMDIYTDLVAQEASNKKKREEENMYKKLMDEIEKLKQENKSIKKKVEDGEKSESKSSRRERRRSVSPEDYERKEKKRRHANSTMSLKSEIEKNHRIKLGSSPPRHSPSPLERLYSGSDRHRSPSDDRIHRSSSSDRRRSHYKKDHHSRGSPSPPEYSHASTLKHRSRSRERSYDKEYSSHHSPAPIKREPRSPCPSPPPSQISFSTTLPSRSNISPLTLHSQLPSANIDTCELPPSFSKPNGVARITSLPIEKDIAHLILYNRTARLAYGIKLNGHLEKKVKKINLGPLVSFVKENFHSKHRGNILPPSFNLLKEMGIEERRKPSEVSGAQARVERNPNNSAENEIEFVVEFPKKSPKEAEILIKKEKEESPKNAAITLDGKLREIKKEPGTSEYSPPHPQDASHDNINNTLNEEIKKEKLKEDLKTELDVHKKMKKEKSKKKKHKSHIKEEPIKKEPLSHKEMMPKTIQDTVADIKDPRLKSSPPYIALREQYDFEYLACKFKRDEKHITFGPKIKKKSQNKKETEKQA